MSNITASVDIGGTFTDIIIQIDQHITGYFKVPTTPKEPEIGLTEGLRKHVNGDISEIVHATTIATNAILGQYGLELPKVALITTKGFKDVIEIARQNRPSLYDLNFQKPRTLIPRDLRFVVDERTDTHGNISKKVEDSSINDLLDRLRDIKPDSIAITFLNSYLNSSNEEEIARRLSDHFRLLSVSSQVSPEQREYERTSTTVINAVLMPIVSRYIERLNGKMEEFGAPDISVMSSSGGLITTDEVFQRPVQMLESGPAAGVIASAEMSKALGLEKVISFDMGGTTAKAGTIVDGVPSIIPEYEVGGTSHHGRMAKGSGYPVRFPFVDLAEVSAGGGTVIWKDEAGGINVGPMSSGAEPGPVCYGKGGIEATVSDANLVLGIIGDSLLGGEMKLDLEAAKKSLHNLGDPYEVAESALNLVNLEMARAIRIVTVERGLDPSEFVMMAFGGAGPQHAAYVADEIGITKVVIPPRPGLFSAQGLLLSDWKYEARKSFPDNTVNAFTRLEEDLGKKFDRATYLRYADCRYRGQGSELTVSIKSTDRKDIEASFRKLHESVFGFNLEREVEIVTIRVFALQERENPVLDRAISQGKDTGKRPAFIHGRSITIPVYWKDALKPSTEINGPCSIEDYDSTVLVPENWSAEVGSMNQITLTRLD